MKKLLSAFVVVSLLASLFVGCNKSEPENPSSAPDSSSSTVSEKSEEQPESKEEKEESKEEVTVNFSDWNGKWNNLVSYMDDPGVEKAYEEIAEKEEIEPSVVKERFQKRYATEIVAFTIEGDTLTVYNEKIDGEPKEDTVVTTNTYTFVEQIEEGSTWNYFKANEKDAKYPIMLMIAPGRDVEDSAYHTHYRYGDNLEELLAMEGLYPTMVASDSTTEEVYKMLVN